MFCRFEGKGSFRVHNINIIVIEEKVCASWSGFPFRTSFTTHHKHITKNIMCVCDPLIRFIQGTLHTLHNFMLLRRDGCLIQNLCRFFSS